MDSNGGETTDEVHRQHLSLANLYGPAAWVQGNATAPKEKQTILITGATALTVESGGGSRRFSDGFRAVEDAVKSSGMKWTILRCADFTANALAWAPQIRATAKVRGAYGDAATSTIDERDVAAVAAARSGISRYPGTATR